MSVIVFAGDDISHIWHPSVCHLTSTGHVVKIMSSNKSQCLSDHITFVTDLLQDGKICQSNNENDATKLVVDDIPNIKVIVMFTYLHDLTQRSYDSTTSNNEGLIKVVQNVNVNLLTKKSIEATQLWKKIKPYLKVIWTLPPHLDFLKCNEHFVISNKQDSLSEREIRKCLISTDLFARYTSKLKANFVVYLMKDVIDLDSLKENICDEKYSIESYVISRTMPALETQKMFKTKFWNVLVDQKFLLTSNDTETKDLEDETNFQIEDVGEDFFGDLPSEVATKVNDNMSFSDDNKVSVCLNEDHLQRESEDESVELQDSLLECSHYMTLVSVGDNVVDLDNDAEVNNSNDKVTVNKESSCNTVNEVDEIESTHIYNNDCIEVKKRTDARVNNENVESSKNAKVNGNINTERNVNPTERELDCDVQDFSSCNGKYDNMENEVDADAVTHKEDDVEYLDFGCQSLNYKIIECLPQEEVNKSIKKNENSELDGIMSKSIGKSTVAANDHKPRNEKSTNSSEIDLSDGWNFIANDELIYDDIDDYENDESGSAKPACDTEATVPYSVQDHTVAEGEVHSPTVIDLLSEDEIEFDGQGQNGTTTVPVKYYTNVAHAQECFNEKKEYFLGLQYILEIHEQSSSADLAATLYPSASDTYVCVLCSKKLSSVKVLQSHINSLPHKLKFCKEHLPLLAADYDSIPLAEWTAATLQQFKRRLEKEGAALGGYRLGVCQPSDLHAAAAYIKQHLGQAESFPRATTNSNGQPSSRHKSNVKQRVLVVGRPTVRAWQAMASSFRSSLRFTVLCNNSPAFSDLLTAAEQRLCTGHFDVLVMIISEKDVMFKTKENLVRVQDVATVLRLTEIIQKTFDNWMESRPSLRVVWAVPYQVDFKTLVSSDGNKPMDKSLDIEPYAAALTCDYRTRLLQLTSSLQKRNHNLIDFGKSSKLDLVNGIRPTQESLKMMWDVVKGFVEELVCNRDDRGDGVVCGAGGTESPVFVPDNIDDVECIELEEDEGEQQPQPRRSRALSPEPKDAEDNNWKRRRLSPAVQIFPSSSGSRSPDLLGSPERRPSRSPLERLHTRRSSSPWARSPSRSSPGMGDRRRSPVHASKRSRSKSGTAVNSERRSDYPDSNVQAAQEDVEEVDGLSELYKRQVNSLRDVFKLSDLVLLTARDGNRLHRQPDAPSCVTPRLGARPPAHNPPQQHSQQNSESRRGGRFFAPQRRGVQRHHQNHDFGGRSSMPHQMAVGPQSQNSMPQPMAVGPQLQKSMLQQMAVGPQLQNSMHQPMTVGSQLQNSMPQQMAVGSQLQNSMHQQMAVGSQLQNSMHQQMAVGSQLQNSRHQQMAVGSQLQNSMHQQMAVGSQLQNSMHQQMAIVSQSRTSMHQQMAIGSQSHTSMHQQMAVGSQSRTSMPQLMVTEPLFHNQNHDLINRSSMLHQMVDQPHMQRSAHQSLPLNVPLQAASARPDLPRPNNSSVWRTCSSADTPNNARAGTSSSYKSCKPLDDIISTLKTLIDLTDLTDVSAPITTLLVSAVNNKMMDGDPMDIFLVPKNIVAAKIVYDKVESMILTEDYGDLDSVPYSMNKCYHSLNWILSAIERKVFLGIDVFTIASDTADMPQSLVLSTLDSSLECARREAGLPSQKVAQARELILNVIEKLNIENSKVKMMLARRPGSFSSVDGAAAPQPGRPPHASGNGPMRTNANEPRRGDYYELPPSRSQLQDAFPRRTHPADRQNSGIVTLPSMGPPVNSFGQQLRGDGYRDAQLPMHQMPRPQEHHTRRHSSHYQDDRMTDDFGGF